MLHPSGLSGRPDDVGEELRQRIRALLSGDPSRAPSSPTPAAPLAFKGETVIQARGAPGGADRCTGPVLGDRR